jgi:hypothetical protein
MKGLVEVPTPEPPPVALNVVPVRVRLEPIVRLFTGEVPLPIMIPKRVVEPVPPSATCVGIAFARAGLKKVRSNTIPPRSLDKIRLRCIVVI